jgi:hypothetical protein
MLKFCSAFFRGRDFVEVSCAFGLLLEFGGLNQQGPTLAKPLTCLRGRRLLYRQQSWTDRTGYGAQGAAPDDDVQAALRRNGFHHVQTSLGSMGILGHWVGLAGTLAPIVIGELVDDRQSAGR